MPEPVAPTSTPCGPMPSSAACLRSSHSSSPVSVRPIGARSASARGRSGGAGEQRLDAIGAEQLDQPHARPEPALAVAAALGEPQRRQRARDRLGDAEIDLVDADLRDRRRVLAPDLPAAEPALGHREPGVDVRGLLVALVDEQDAARPSASRARVSSSRNAGPSPTGPDGRVAVDDHDQLGRGELEARRVCGVGVGEPAQVVGARAQLALEQQLELLRRAREQQARRRPERPDRRAGAAATCPTPSRPRARARSTVSSRRSCGARAAASCTISPRAQARERSRAPVTASTPLSARSTTTGWLRSFVRRSSSLRASRSEPFWCSASGFTPRSKSTGRSSVDGALAEPHVQEVLVVRAALPDVAALHELRPQRLRVGVQARQRGALQLARARQVEVLLAQVVGVAPRVGRGALAHAALLRPAHAERERQQQDDHRAGDVEERARP